MTYKQKVREKKLKTELINYKMKNEKNWTRKRKKRKNEKKLLKD